MDERGWANLIRQKLSSELKAVDEMSLRADDGRKLPYLNEIYQYDENYTPKGSSPKSYETDLLISDVSNSGEFTPRVVIECKLRISTHDALTYSAKASTHKHVHPYLRYGILLGARKDYAIPGRLVRHGAHFDFMIAWKAMEHSEHEWKMFLDILTDEVLASRQLQGVLETSRSSKRMKYHIVHRPLRLRKSE